MNEEDDVPDPRITAALVAHRRTLNIMSSGIEDESDREKARNAALLDMTYICHALGFSISDDHSGLLDVYVAAGRKLDARIDHLTDLKLFHSNRKHCAKCLSRNVPLMKCSGCMKVRYCSVECQREDRKKHKPMCKKE